MRAVLLSAAAVLLLAVPAGGAPHRYRLHPNPAITVLSIAEGPDGLLWLAAEDGLYRYDGLHYHKIPGFPFGMARFAAFTSDGSLWCGGIEGLARLRRGVFTVLFREQVYGMAARGDQLFVNRRDLVQVDPAGAVRFLGYKALRDLNFDARGHLWFVCAESRRACSLDPADPAALRQTDLPAGYEEAVPDGQGRLWASAGERAAWIRDGNDAASLERQRSAATRRVGPLVPGRNGQLWFNGETVRGLNPPVEFADSPATARFAPTAGYEDRRGHFWVAQQGRGLVEWIPDPSWQRWFPEDYGGEAVQVTAAPLGGVLLATGRHLLEFRSGWRRLSRTERRFDSVLPLPNGELLAAARGLGILRLSAGGAELERLGDPAEEFRELVRDPSGRVWAAAKKHLWRLEGTPGSLHLVMQTLPGAAAAASAVDLEVDAAGRLWAGYAAGVARLDDNLQWRRIETATPVTLVRSLAIGPDEAWVAHRLPGQFTRLSRDGDLWRGQAFRARDGFGPVDTHFLKRDSRGWIWRGTPEGVQVAASPDLSAAGWLRLGADDGLTALETSPYGFHQDADGNVWIAGEKGVTRMRPAADWFTGAASAAAPRITRVEADGIESLLPEQLPALLATGVRRLRIEFGGLETPPFRSHPLRYRLQPAASSWTLSRDGVAEFRELAAGDYVLEAAYAGGGAVARYAFRSGAPGGRSLFSWLALLTAGAGAFAAVRYLPWFEVWNYRIDKALFVLRRRFRRARGASDPRGSADAEDLTGWSLGGRYELTRLVSRGGFAAVYEARDAARPGMRFAVKVLRRGAASEGWVRDRFAHEVAALRSVAHPGVVAILDSWVTERGEPCLAMPFVEGPTLREELRQGPLPPLRAALLLRELGDALAAVHERGVVHRDLKPENLILPGGRLMILDFGTAGLRSATDELAATTLMAGSFHYLAPERLTGHYSPASDVYSVGVIALEMLTGKRLADLRHLSTDPAFAAELQQELGGSLSFARCLQQAFQPDPRARPADVAAWTAELAGLLLQA